MKKFGLNTLRMCHTFLLVTALLMAIPIVQADPHTGQSVKVAIIGGTTLDNGTPCGNNYYAANVMGYTGGGCLPANGSAGELGDFSFTAMYPSAVSAANLTAYDTVVLNMASYAMARNASTLTSSQKTDIVSFVGAGKKLIIFDSECSYSGSGIDYSWIPFPFRTANPGAMGSPGTLTIVEENLLSSNITTNLHYINASYLSIYTDAVGDMNVMTTYDPNWCIDMSGTNYLQVTGPVHTYAKYPAGTDRGLILYNGLDQDYQYNGEKNLRKIWVQELQQPFNPSNLPCGVTVVGITLTPPNATNIVGQTHTVTATLKDQLGTPQPGILVTFNVVSGPNSGTTGNGTTDKGGQASFSYIGSGGVGIDEIQACFTDESGQQVCSQKVTKEWIITSILEVPVDVRPLMCNNLLIVNDIGVFPAAILGTSSFDVTQVDVSTVKLESISPRRSVLLDVASPFMPYTGKKDFSYCTTAGPDGFMDLTMTFSTKSIIAALGPVANGDVKVLHLTGKLLDSTDIVGEDVVLIIKK